MGFISSSWVHVKDTKGARPSYLLDGVPGIIYEVDRVNFAQSDEIDIAVANTGDLSGLACFPTLFLVEAKNWKDPVDSSSVGAFIDKLRDRHIELGILVAASGVTGDPTTLRAAYHKAASAQTSGYRILLSARARSSLHAHIAPYRADADAVDV